MRGRGDRRSNMHAVASAGSRERRKLLAVIALIPALLMMGAGRWWIGDRLGEVVHFVGLGVVVYIILYYLLPDRWSSRMRRGRRGESGP